ncbi:MAG: hypothetical protein ABIJ26_00640, partial [Candidatus Margulisiibacteriota bacterium]
MASSAFAGYLVQIDNSNGGEIAVMRSGTSEVIGHVVYPTIKVNSKGYTASQWVAGSQVAATAVNAIHIKVDDAKTIFSILPVEFGETQSIASLRGYRSYLSPDSSIYTDIPAGAGIFGGGYAPYVGSQVLINGEKVAKDQTPKEGDLIQIDIEPPSDAPKELVFENKFKGAVKLVHFDGNEEVVGEVLRPVQGIGRFDGTLYCDPGRIRANHAGVIDISTSPVGELGGFQIVPAEHAQSPEMKYARLKTQWMVVSAPSLFGPAMPGQPPLFRAYLRPDYMPDDLSSNDWYDRLAQRFLVEVRLDGKGEWQPMPIVGLAPGYPLPESADSAL